MAKTEVKKTKKAAPKKKSTTSSEELIVKACIASLGKLSEMNLDHQLQSEINWCLGSYQNDGNPVGLYEMASRCLALFKEAKASKIKGITPSLITDLEKAVNSR